MCCFCICLVVDLLCERSYRTFVDIKCRKDHFQCIEVLTSKIPLHVKPEWLVFKKICLMLPRHDLKASERMLMNSKECFNRCLLDIQKTADKQNFLFAKFAVFCCGRKRLEMLNV